MNHLIFTADNGASIDFNWTDGLIIAHIDNLTNHSAGLSTTQAWQQVGQSVGGISYQGRSITVKGYVKTQKARKKLLDSLLPGARGVLVFENQYEIDCYVQDSPTIEQERFGAFSFRLFAPYPWWRSITPNVIMLGIITPNFCFPVNYAEPHRFGTVDRSEYINVINHGMLPCSYELEISGSASIYRPEIINMYTLEKISFDATVAAGEVLRFTQKDGALSVTLTSDDEGEQDIFQTLAYDSTMFSLSVGDNILQVKADTGAENMQVIIRYYDVYAGVTNDM